MDKFTVSIEGLSFDVEAKQRAGAMGAAWKLVKDHYGDKPRPSSCESFKEFMKSAQVTKH